MGGYVSYESTTGKFYLTGEQAFAMADETSPAFMPGAFQVALAAAKAEEELTGTLQNQGRVSANLWTATGQWHARAECKKLS